MDCDKEQMRCKGTSNLSDEGVGFFWWGWFVTVLNVHEVHTSAGCPKQGLRMLAAMPTVEEIGSADLCGWRFVKGKSAAQIVNEHGLEDGMSKPGRKTRQGHRLTRIGSKTGLKGAGSHANSGRNRQRRFMRLWVRQRRIGSAYCCWTMECPSQARKLVRGIGWV